MAFNYLPLKNEVYQESAALALAKGARLQVGDQLEYLPEAKELVKCLLGFPNSNRELGDYLRENRHLRLTEFLGSARYQEQDKREALVEWKEALLKGKPLRLVPFLVGLFLCRLVTFRSRQEWQEWSTTQSKRSKKFEGQRCAMRASEPFGRSSYGILF